jgi:corrinoid protein of di/trimethylamine methyltransferase
VAEEIVPKNLGDPLRNALVGGDKDGAVQATEQALLAKVPPLAIIQEVIVPTLTEIGEKFENLEIFLPELMAAGVAGTAASALVEEALAKEGSETAATGTVVIGTVKGDIHDIGKNIVASLLRAHGYRVIDVGKDASAKRFIEAAEQNKADLIAASALMSITRAGCREVADLLREMNLKDRYPLIVGGGSMDQAYADEIGADGYAANAAGAVTLANEIIDPNG